MKFPMDKVGARPPEAVQCLSSSDFSAPEHRMTVFYHRVPRSGARGACVVLSLQRHRGGG